MRNDSIASVKISVGLELYQIYSHHLFRENDKSSLTGERVRVVSIGRKYFEVASVREIDSGHSFLIKTRFRIDDWSEDNGGYSARHRLYKDEQEFLDEVEFENSSRKVYLFFEREMRNSSGALSLDQLRRIQSIINEKKHG